MEPVREAEEISNIAFGYIASKALFAALHINVFTLLAKGPLTAADIAAKTSVPENRVTTLVTVLLSLGLLIKVSEGFENSPGAASFLSRGAKYDFSDYLRYQVDRQMFPFMADLEAVMSGNTASDAIDSYSKWMADPAEAKLYSDSQHSGSLGPARSLDRRGVDVVDGGDVIPLSVTCPTSATTSSSQYPLPPSPRCQVQS